MQVVFPDRATRAAFEDEGRSLDIDEFLDFCAKNPNLRIERMPDGEILIMPPTGLEAFFQNSEISAQLRNWARGDGRGIAFDSNAEFILQSGAAFAPDAAWIIKSRLAGLTKSQKREFGHLCPDFVVELRSPSDRLASLKSKMDEWMRNGVQLGCLIDPDRRTIYIYRPGKPVEEVRDATSIEGDPPVQGFRLDLEAVWEGF